jgi:hypothetical protein
MFNGTENLLEADLSDSMAILNLNDALSREGAIQEMLGEGHDTNMATVLALLTIGKGSELKVTATTRVHPILHIDGPEVMSTLLVTRDIVEELGLIQLIVLSINGEEVFRELLPLALWGTTEPINQVEGEYLMRLRDCGQKSPPNPRCVIVEPPSARVHQGMASR